MILYQIQEVLIYKPHDYIKRALLLTSIKYDIKAKLIQKQNFKCSICHFNIIDYYNLNSWSANSNIINYNYNIYSYDYDNNYNNNNNNNNNNNYNNNNFIYNNYSFNYNIHLMNILSKNKSNSWFEDIQIDHIIPRKIGYLIPQINSIIENDNNKVILHKTCHILKTAIDRKTILKEYINIKKSIINNKNYKNITPKLLDILILKELLINNNYHKIYIQYLSKLYDLTIINSTKIHFNKIIKIVKKLLIKQDKI